MSDTAVSLAAQQHGSSTTTAPTVYRSALLRCWAGTGRRVLTLHHVCSILNHPVVPADAGCGRARGRASGCARVEQQGRLTTGGHARGCLVHRRCAPSSAASQAAATSSPPAQAPKNYIHTTKYSTVHTRVHTKASLTVQHAVLDVARDLLGPEQHHGQLLIIHLQGHSSMRCCCVTVALLLHASRANSKLAGYTAGCRCMPLLPAHFSRAWDRLPTGAAGMHATAREGDYLGEVATLRDTDLLAH